MTIDQHTTPDPEPPAAPRRDLPAEGGASAPEAVQAADVDRGSRDTKELEVERPARGWTGCALPTCFRGRVERWRAAVSTSRPDSRSAPGRGSSPGPRRRLRACGGLPRCLPSGEASPLLSSVAWKGPDRG